MVRRFSPPKELIILWCVALFAWWIRYHPPGLDLLVFDDDARQHVYWTARFQDPELFQDDLQTDFIISSGFNPLGYRALYWLGTRFLDPLSFSQFVTLLLLLTSLWLLHELSSEIIPNSRGRLVCGLLFLFYSLYMASGGFPRSFTYPILLAFLVLLHKGAFRLAMSTMLAAVLFYPPVFINILALAAWEFFCRRIRRVKGRRLLSDFLTLVLVVSACGLFLFSQYGNTDDKMWGEHVTLEQAKAMPEFHPQGRTAFFRSNPVSYLLLGRSGIGATHIVGFVIIFLLIPLFWGVDRIRFPSISRELVLTSLIVFGAAHFLLFRLHLPSRYTLYTIPLAFILAIGASLAGVFERYQAGPEPIPGKKGGGRVSKGLGWVAPAILLCAYGYVQGHYICRIDPQLVTLNREDREMLGFLATLTKDTLVAGHPMDMDNVPLVTRRKVLANHEMSLPYYLGYYHQIRIRISDMLKAYYTTRWEDVESFINHYGVDSLVIRNEHFRKDFVKGRLYFEPFNNELKKSWGIENRFLLADPPTQLRCFENNRYIVLCWES